MQTPARIVHLARRGFIAACPRASGGTATTASTLDVVGKYPQHWGVLLGAVQAFGFLAFAAGPAAEESQLRLLRCRPELAGQRDSAGNLPLHVAAHHKMRRMVGAASRPVTQLPEHGHPIEQAADLHNACATVA